MTNAAQWPLLGESELPIASTGALKRADVLNDSTLLVVSLLEEKAVVLDLPDQGQWRQIDEGANSEQ
jgi:hypothetical protein